MKGKNICKFTFKIGKVVYSLRISTHARERIIERNLDESLVIKNVLSTELRILEEMKVKKYDLMIIDVENNFTTVVRRNKNKIIIVTAIAKANELNIKPNIKTKILIKK